MQKVAYSICKHKARKASARKASRKQPATPSTPQHNAVVCLTLTGYTDMKPLRSSPSLCGKAEQAYNHICPSKGFTVFFFPRSSSYLRAGWQTLASLSYLSCNIKLCVA